MPQERATVVYHLDYSGCQPGQLIRVEDSPGGHSDVFFHPLHIREQLVHELNQLGLHQVGHGLWRQRWIEPGRESQPAEGLHLAESWWEIVPVHKMPKRRHVMPIEQDGRCIWHIKDGSCTDALVDEMNRKLERIVGDGLWWQSWHEEQQASLLRLAPHLAPVVNPTRV